MTEEVWKDIKGYDGKYQVSNLGSIKSMNYKRTNKEKTLSLVKNKDGYLNVCLWKDGKSATLKVHRLVAKAFVTNINNYNEVNHLDENKENNCAENLVWVTRKQNINWGTARERSIKNTDYKTIGKLNGIRNSKKVYQYNSSGDLVKIWNSTKECEIEGFKSTNVSRCCRGGLRTYKNYVWGYTEIPKDKVFINFEISREKQSNIIYQYDKEYKLIKIWNSNYQCQKAGYRRDSITQCCIGNKKMYNKCYWSYEPII